MDLLFPSLVTSFKDKDFINYKKDFIKYCYFLKKTTNGEIKSNSLGWHSESNIHLRDDFIFLQKIIELINQTAKEFYFENCSISLDSLWVNINPQWAYNKTHRHPRNNLSGVFYLKVPSNSGSLVFVNESIQTSELYHYIKDSTLKCIKTYPSYKYEPEEGRMFLFDSMLPHYVEQNLSREDRISISFNLNLL